MRMNNVQNKPSTGLSDNFCCRSLLARMDFSESDLQKIQQALSKGFGRSEVEQLLQSDFTLVKKVNKYGVSMLHLAVANSNIEAVRVLMMYNANVNQACKFGVTPLQLAVEINRVDIANLLIENQANVNTVDGLGRTVLTLAVSNHNVDMVRLLLRNHAHVNQKDRYGYTVLHEAVLDDVADIVSLLIEFNAEVNVENASGLTPMHLAISTNRANIVSLLLNSGAKVDMPSDSGYSPFDLANRKMKGKEVWRILYVHVWKLKLANQNVSIDLECLDELPSDVREEVSCNFEKAKTEFDKIKLTEVCEGFYLNTVLSQSTKPMFLRDDEICENLTTLLYSPEFLLEFPMFGHIIKNVFIDSKRSRIYLLHLAVQWMSSERIPECLRDLAVEIKENILRCLSDEELRRIVGV